MRANASTASKRFVEQGEREPHVLAYLAMLALILVGIAALYVTISR